MTFIAFVTDEDHADVVTDTWRYSGGGRRIEESYKVALADNSRIVVLSGGSSVFGSGWQQLASRLEQHTGDFDAFADAATDALPDVWDGYAGACKAQGREPFDSTAFAVGFSPRRGRFAAYGWDTALALERMTLDDPYVQPSSPRFAMGPFERLRLEQMGAGSALDRWSKAPISAPSDDAQWIRVAQHVREVCTLRPSVLQVFVGGELLRVRLRHDGTDVDVIHRFPADEFTQAVAGTLHPLGQAGQCPRCDSGRRYIDCHLANLNGKPCPCGSGVTFAGCCSIYATEETA